jgi:peptidoglycan/LPS O-acetylase OafA/YrhL
MSTPSSTAPAYLTNLTPLRGIAALIVLLFHFDLFWGGPFAGTLFQTDTTLFVKKGYLLVDFFFVLSGFIMAHVYGTSFASSVTRAGFRRFMKARFARIYPLHLFTLAWAVLLFSAITALNFPLDAREKSVYNLSAIPANLVLAQAMGFYPGYTWNGPAWTISVELWMYVAFPFLYGPVSRLPNWGRVAVLAGLLGGYVGLVYGLNNSPQSPWPYSMNVGPLMGGAFARCALSFSVGMVFYSLFQQQWGRAWLANGYATVGFTVAMVVAMHFGWSDIITVATFPFIILSAAYGSRNLNQVLITKPMQRLGDLSFSIYLTNEVIFDSGRVVRFALTGSHQPPQNLPAAQIWLWCIGWLTVVMLVSELTYRFIELPARRALNARFKKPQVLASQFQSV